MSVSRALSYTRSGPSFFFKGQRTEVKAPEVLSGSSRVALGERTPAEPAQVAAQTRPVWDWKMGTVHGGKTDVLYRF